MIYGHLVLLATNRQIIYYNNKVSIINQAEWCFFLCFYVQN